MHLASYFIPPNELWNLIGATLLPRTVDTRNPPAKVA
jgi:hypothetical protein